MMRTYKDKPIVSSVFRGKRKLIVGGIFVFMSLLSLSVHLAHKPTPRRFPALQSSIFSLNLPKPSEHAFVVVETERFNAEWIHSLLQHEFNVLIYLITSPAKRLCLYRSLTTKSTLNLSCSDAWSSLTPLLKSESVHVVLVDENAEISDVLSDSLEKTEHAYVVSSNLTITAQDVAMYKLNSDLFLRTDDGALKMWKLTEESVSESKRMGTIRHVSEWTFFASERVKEKKVISVLVPTISSGEASPEELVFFNVMLPSFVKSINEEERGRFRYNFFVGYDKNDAIWDNEEFSSQIPELFLNITRDIDATFTGITVSGMKGSPPRIWSYLATQALNSSSSDYFYQINDDLIFLDSGWTSAFIDMLESDSLVPNLGVAGPADVFMPRLLTQAFVHRTHFSLFPDMFPYVFKNWYSDDWITEVYSPEFKFTSGEYRINNTNVKSTRYTVYEEARDFLKSEVSRGKIVIEEYVDRVEQLLPGLIGDDKPRER